MVQLHIKLITKNNNFWNIDCWHSNTSSKSEKLAIVSHRLEGSIFILLESDTLPHRLQKDIRSRGINHWSISLVPVTSMPHTALLRVHFPLSFLIGLRISGLIDRRGFLLFCSFDWDENLWPVWYILISAVSPLIHKIILQGFQKLTCRLYIGQNIQYCIYSAVFFPSWLFSPLSYHLLYKPRSTAWATILQVSSYTEHKGYRELQCKLRSH